MTGELDAASQRDRDVNQQAAYALVDMRITLDQIPVSANAKLKLSAWGKNLADKEYRYGSVDLIDNLGFASTQYGEPRTYGVSIQYDFDG